MARLDQICSLNMGQSPDSSSYNEEKKGIPFFQGNAEFGSKIAVALGLLRFGYVGSDAGAAAKQLLRQNIFVLFFVQIPAQIHNPDGKLKAFIKDSIIRHSFNVKWKMTTISFPSVD